MLSIEKKWQYAAIFPVLLSIQSCTVSGWKTEKPSPDTSILTGSVASGQGTSDNSISLLDQKTIRDTVAATDKKNLARKSLDWSNSDTGNRGVISTLAEIKDHGKICRTFQTTHETFDGITLFSGKACEINNDIWTIVDFKAL